MANCFYKEILSKPGIQRDGTSFDAQKYIDGSWVRFYKDRPLKIGGYATIQNGTQEIIRNIFSHNIANGIQLYLGRPSSLSYVTIDTDNIPSGVFDRTPAGFVRSPDNIWSFDTVSYPLNPLEPDAGDTVFLIAVAAPNASSISNTVPGAIYYGAINQTTQLNQIITTEGEPLETTSGIIVLGSYILVYDTDGLVFWNDGAAIDNWPSDNAFNMGSSKIVYGAAVRSGSSLSALFWALDGVILVGFDGTKFLPAYLSTSSTILSSQCVVSFDPYFFWIGENTFYIYNGIIKELPNTTNKEWFFNNINKNAKQKVFGFVNKQYNEIWWCFPFGDSMENNHAIVYNINGEFWYDTNNIDRSCGIAAGSSYQYPIMCSSAPVILGQNLVYPIWVHEYGNNKVQFNKSLAITSYFETNVVNVWEGQPEGQVLQVDTIIPDAVMTGQFLVTVNKRGYPNSAVTSSQLYQINPTTEFITMKEKGSFVSFEFLMNVIDGSYLMGKPLAKILVSDDQRPGPTT